MHHRRTTRSRHDDVEVADGFAPPAKAACYGDFFHSLDAFEVLDQWSREVLCVREANATFRSGQTLEALADQALGLFTKACQFPDLAARQGTLEVAYATDIELVVQALHALGAQSLDLHQLAERPWCAGGDFLEQRKLSRLDDGRNLAGEVLAYAAELGQVLTRTQQFGHAA